MRIIKQLIQAITRPKAGKSTGKPSPSGAVVTPRDKHNISRANISKNTLKVLNRLHEAGYEAYLVGGGVRDLLLDLHPKDFDVATDAHPEKVRRLFRNSRLIGRRFRLVHVFFGPEIIEVATFRGGAGQEESVERRQSEHGMLLRDNVYGTIQDDAWRRDFTINALYYNIADFSVVDFTEGMQDLKRKTIRMLGEPVARYHEDPIRMLRALRLAAKLNFEVEPDTAKPISELSGLIQNVPSARLFDELLKLFYCGKSLAAFELLRHYGLFAVLFPLVEASLAGPHQTQALNLIKQGLQNTDSRVKQGQSLNPAFLFAFMFWSPLQNLIIQYQEQGMKFHPALHAAMNEVIQHQLQHIAIPRRFTTMMREIWQLQNQLQQRRRISSVFIHPRFRAAYDFLLLRAESGENVKAQGDWWEKFQSANSEERHKMMKEFERSHRHRKSRRVK